MSWIEINTHTHTHTPINCTYVYIYIEGNKVENIIIRNVLFVKYYGVNITYNVY